MPASTSKKITTTLWAQAHTSKKKATTCTITITTLQHALNVTAGTRQHLFVLLKFSSRFSWLFTISFFPLGVCWVSSRVFCLSRGVRYSVCLGKCCCSLFREARQVPACLSCKPFSPLLHHVFDCLSLLCIRHHSWEENGDRLLVDSVGGGLR